MKAPGKRTLFGDVQLLAYLLSCTGMLVYTCLYFRDAVLFQNDMYGVGFRVFLHGTLELLLLLQRTVNEVIHGKIGVGDVGHHLSMVLTFYLVIYKQNCKPFGWVVCHMQILHYPMFLWYLGCRKNSFFENNYEISSFCKELFSPVWFFAVAYRSTILLSTLLICLVKSEYFVLSIVLPITLLMMYLDSNWTVYFIAENLGWPRNGAIPIAFTTFGVVSGVLSAFIL